MNYFLVQVSKQGSSSLLLENKYVNNNWNVGAKDQHQRFINVNDLLIFYFTGKAIIDRSQIKYIYRVCGISNYKQTLDVKIHQVIKPLSLKDISLLINQKQLSYFFKYCGHQGFNIKKILKKDYLFLSSLMTNEIVPSEVIQKWVLPNLNNDDDVFYNAISDINLLSFYINELDNLTTTVRKKLLKSGFIEIISNNGVKKIVLTKRGKSILEKTKTQRIQ